MQPVPSLSVIIVTYNAAATLQKCLDSVFMQLYPDIRIIIIDGGSADETVDIIKNNEEKLFYWKSESDKGIYDAMNKALNVVNGDWVYFIGADDELLPEFSSMATQLIDPTAIYYANVMADGEKRLGKLSHYQLAKFGIYHQAIIFPRSIFSITKYDLKYKISADYALLLQIAGKPGVNFVYKDYTIANYNHTGISGTHIDELFQRDKANLIFKSFGLVTWIRYRIHKFKNRTNPRA